MANAKDMERAINTQRVAEAQVRFFLWKGCVNITPCKWTYLLYNAGGGDGQTDLETEKKIKTKEKRERRKKKGIITAVRGKRQRAFVMYCKMTSVTTPQ